MYQESQNKSCLTIFLVDDQKISNFITKKVIELSGVSCEISVFEDPKIAFIQFQEKKPHVIFLDLNMPEMDGWDFLEEMNKIKHSSNVIILSSSTSNLDITRATEYSQVISYQTKPPSREKFKALLEGF
jgi:response regulator RpfG family c-di-GMP phosphodiesterase